MSHGTHDAAADKETSSVATRAALALTYPADTRSVGAARDDLASFLGDTDDAMRERAVLVISELMSNAVEVSRDPILLSMTTSGRTSLRICVRNRAPDSEVPERDQWGPDEPLALRGRGLAIIETLAHSVEVERDGDWVVVTAVMCGTADTSS